MSASGLSTDRLPGRWRHWSLRALRVALALVFLAAGGAKIAGMGRIVDLVERIGWGQGFRFVTAAAPIPGAVLLLVPRAAWIGPGLLLATMIGALTVNLSDGKNPSGAIVLGAIAAIVLWARRPSAA